MSWDPRNQGGYQGSEKDIEEVIRQAKSQFESFKNKGKGLWTLVIILIIAGIGALTAAYTIQTGHRGVVLRFGKFAGVVSPGLHFKIPFGVDRVIDVHTEKVETEAFGFRSATPGVRAKFQKDPETAKESMILTGDLNVIDMEWIVQYRRQDPRKFLFSIHDPVQTIRDISETVARQIVGDRSFDYVLQNREEVNRIFQDDLQEILDGYDSGIRIVGVRLQNVVPPDAVKNAFNEVNEAQQEKERLINEAQETYNREIPKARGEAERLINSAQGYALERVNRAKGETSRFSDVLAEYRSAKEVTKKRLYLETYQEVIPKAKDVYVIDSKQKTILPMLDLDKMGSRSGGEQ
ncbi:MAG: Modulator of FtsH protease HflK [Deltaproteobacteria bacterium ADurb.BinA179]|jgi:membrane protease subunit HflK|nr:MAG: Modulator of FtsH protease HflK [Deltaproteobacteria bacterium ADurb.BinA179]HNU73325.1 FtsH protease activity modulator HflK [Deltaproteobacteria bacterium]HOE73926.1 FtsH protease activity modulator HflK [Deltaproteobacteria bacterium]HON61022.1 FtsH protease activity modulator HflK [Deltaproteobacteria bacterium]HPA84635.1 FtsH protease activity modulator HflK [Deltaproteobacteria bacterium]